MFYTQYTVKPKHDLIWKHIWKYYKGFASHMSSLVKIVIFMCFEYFKTHFSNVSFKFNWKNHFSTLNCVAVKKQSCKTCYPPSLHGVFSVSFPPKSLERDLPLTFWGKQVKPRLKQEEMQCEIQRCSNSLMKMFYKRIGLLAKSEHEKYPTSTLTHIIHYVWWLWE